MRRFRFLRPLAFLVLLPLISVLSARIHPFGDAGLNTWHTAAPPLLRNSSVPLEVRAILVAKCADCHSTLTRAPFYRRFAPASWLIESDIMRARSAMNLSAWQNYSTAQQEAFKAKIAHEARMHTMPPIQYRLMHWRSRVNDAELRTLLGWANGNAEDDSEDVRQSGEAGDRSRGKAVFERRCTGCHALNANREGPRLADVYGRTSGTVDNFDYSPALKRAHIAWSETTLERWLTDPDALVPGNNMDFHVPKPQERRDVIEFLQSEGMTSAPGR